MICVKTYKKLSKFAKVTAKILSVLLSEHCVSKKGATFILQ